MCETIVTLLSTPVRTQCFESMGSNVNVTTQCRSWKTVCVGEENLCGVRVCASPEGDANAGDVRSAKYTQTM